MNLKTLDQMASHKMGGHHEILQGSLGHTCRETSDGLGEVEVVEKINEADWQPFIVGHFWGWICHYCSVLLTVYFKWLKW